MPFTVQLSGFTLGVSILNVDLYGCTGTTAICTTGATNDLTNYFVLTGHTNIGRNDLNGRYVVVPDGIKTIKVVPSNLNDGGCVLGTDFNLIRLNTPLTPTPTVTPTNTPTSTPTPTPTPTPPPCSFNATIIYGLPPTPTPTATSTPTPTPTGTPTPTPTVTPTPTPTQTEVIPVEYQIDNAASGTSSEACSSATTTSIVYAEPGYTVPIVTMILYNSTSLINPFIGSSGWRKLTGPLGTYAVEISTSGEITNYVTCS